MHAPFPDSCMVALVQETYWEQIKVPHHHLAECKAIIDVKSGPRD